MFMSYEMDSVTRVQILDKAIYFLLPVKTFEYESIFLTTTLQG